MDQVEEYCKNAFSIVNKAANSVTEHKRYPLTVQRGTPQAIQEVTIQYHLTCA